MKLCRSGGANKLILKGLRWQLYPTRDTCRCFMRWDSSSMQRLSEYVNGCGSAGSESYANKNTSHDTVVMERSSNTWPIAWLMWLPRFTPSTSGFNPTEMQISCIWTTYVSGSDLCIAHIRAARFITAHGIKFWVRYQEEGAWTTNHIHGSILGFYITLIIYVAVLCRTAAQGKIYGDKLWRKIRNRLFFLFAPGSLVSLFVPGITVVGRRCQRSPNCCMICSYWTVKLTTSPTGSAVHPDISSLWIQKLSVNYDCFITVFKY